MYRFFVEESQIYDGTVHITGSDVNHIKNVLRMRPGEKILVSTGGEKEYHCAVSDFPEGEVLAAVEEVTAADRELPSGIVLFQGLPKGDKMELIIQKAVELGATQIVNASFLNVRSEVLLHTLEDRQIYVSAGSACSSHKRAGSPTLTAIGASKAEMESAVRFSFSEFTTLEQIDYTLDTLREVLPMLRRFTRK